MIYIVYKFFLKFGYKIYGKIELSEINQSNSILNIQALNVSEFPV